MSIGDWAALATTELQATAAWISDAALVVFGALVFCRLVLRWRAPWLVIGLAAGSGLAARMLAEGRIWWWPATPPFPFS